MELGARVRELRRERGWTLEQLADAAGVSKGFLSGIENNRAQPTGPVLLKIANALGASVDYLLQGEAAAPRPEERKVVEVPPELVAIAEQRGWSARRVFEVLRARQSLLARRSDKPHRPFTQTEWAEFADRIAPYLTQDDENE